MNLKIDHKNYQVEEHSKKDWKTKLSQILMGQYHNECFRIKAIENMVHTQTHTHTQMLKK